MKQEAQFSKCSEHDLQIIAIDMNPSADPSCRQCCINCLQDPLKVQYCLSQNEARAHLLNKKKIFKQRKETQIQNNISTLKELDQNIIDMKNKYVQIFDQIKEIINHQIQQYQEQNSNLEKMLNSIHLDQYLSDANIFAAESLTNLEFKEKCQNLMESIFSQSNIDQFIQKLGKLDDQSIQSQSERNIEKNNQIKKQTQLSFKCQKHDEEIRWYNEGQSKLFEDRLICDECSIDKKGPFKLMLSIQREWEQQKITQVQYIQEGQQQFTIKLRNTIQHYKDYQKELNNVINKIIVTLEKEDYEEQNIYRSKINKSEQDWCTLSKQQLIKIIYNLYQPLLRDNKIINRQLKQEMKRDQLNSLLNNQLTLLIKIIKNNLQVIMKSITYDYNLLKVIQQEELNVIEQESQTTQETNSIQCQTVRFSKIQYINQFIMKLSDIEQQLKQQQFNEALIKDQFNYIYSLFKLIKQEKVQFKEFCNKMFIIIQQEFKKYDLQISNEEENKNKYIKKLLQYPQNSQEFFLLQDIFPQEQLTLFFDPIKGDVKDYTYYKNQNKSIEDRINSSSKKQILLFNKFYQWKIKIKWITLQDFQTYLEKHMLFELEAYCEGDYQNKLEGFLNSFACLGFEIVKDNVTELKKTLPSWFQSEKKKQQLLRSCFKQNKNVNNFMGYWWINENQYPNFFKYLQQKEEYLQLMEHDQVTGLIQQYQNDNKLINELNVEVVTIKNIDEIILNEKLNDCKLKLYEHMGYVMEPIYKTLEYVREKSYENKMICELYIPVVIEVALSQNDNEGWKQILIEIDEIILDELQIKKDNSIIENEQNLNITQYLRRQIQIIISKIQQKIKDFNLHFTNFGVIFNDFAIKCIFQYAFFVIWRFLCIQEMSKEKLIEEYQFNQQYLKFQIDISENQIEKSRYFGNLLAENIKLLSIQKLYAKYSMNYKEIFGDLTQEQSSFDLIKKLDNEILLGQDKNVTNDQILEYLKNQTNYIVKYIRQKILNIKQKLSDQIKDELTLILKNAQTNIKHLCEFDNYPQNIHDYFDQLKDPDQALDLLHQIVVNCLQGQINQQLLNMIKPEYRDKFKNKDSQIFTDQLCNYDELDIQIHDLYTFTLAFQQKMDTIISELKDFQIDFQKLDKINSQLENIEIKLIGCLEQCPMCGRKCDSELYDKEHQHQCKNGHLLIAMNKKNKCKFSSSLFSCEELQDDYIIFDRLKPIFWKQFKEQHQSWTFSFSTDKDQQEIQQKFKQYWKNISIFEQL